MATFTCYLPDELLERLDAKLGEGPDFNMGRASRSGILRVLLEQYLDAQPTRVKDVFTEALAEGQARRYDLGKEQLVSRADSFRRTTQR